MTVSVGVILWLGKATALLLLAAGLTIGLRRAPAGARHLVWLATLATLLLVPVMSAWSPLPLRVLPELASTAVAPAVGTPTPAVDVTPRSQAPSGVSTPPAETRGALAMLSLSDRILLGWAAVAGVLMLWLIAGAWSVRRIVRRSRVLSDERWLTPLYETADRLDLDRVPRLVMSSAIEMPFACNILKPTIVLPASAEQWTDERRRVVLFHELAHIRRRDLLGHTLGRIVCALYWFHPLVWSAAKRLRAESERACDDLVLACGARASDYANHLLDIVTGVRRQGAPATALPMANKREFEGRMLAILDPAVERTSPSRGQKLLLTIGLGSVALTIAAVSPERRVAPSEQPSAMTNAPQTSDEVATQEPAGRARQQSEAQPAAQPAARPWPATSPMPAADPSPVASQTSTSARTETRTSTSRTMGASEFLQRSITAGIQSLFQGAQEQQQVDTALLGRVLRTDRSAEVRRSATWVLQGRRDGVPLLLERLRVDESDDVREMAVWALAGSPGGADVEAAIVTALGKDASPDVRATAAWALGQSRFGNHLPALEAALDDASSDVRHRALWAIGQHDLDVAPTKVVAALKESDSEVRMVASWVLGQILDRSTVPALREAFLKETDADAQMAQFRALLFMRDRSTEIIERAMKSESGELRAKAVQMIAGNGPGVWPWPWPWPMPRPQP